MPRAYIPRMSMKERTARRKSIIAYFQAHPDAPNCDIASAHGVTEGWVSSILIAAGLREKTKPREKRVISEQQAKLIVASERKAVELAEKIDPLRAASVVLPGFNRETMTYQGRRYPVDEIMRMANRQRVKHGMPQIDYSPNWVV